MDRGVVTYIAAFLAGILSAKCIILPPVIILILLSAACILLFPFLLPDKKHYRSRIFVIAAHSILFVSGITHFAAAGSRHPVCGNSNTRPFKENMARSLRKMIPDDKAYATLAAITLGDKKELPRELKEAYGKSGGMHILALSGLHMGIIYLFVTTLFSFLNFTHRARFIRAILSMAVILAYGHMTGFPPSVQRAIIMLLIHNMLTLSGRRCSRYNIIVISAFYMTVADPGQLFTIGFQLSFAAVAGIAYIYPVLETAFAHFFPCKKLIYSSNLQDMGRQVLHRCLRSVWSITALSVSCQVTTLPLTLYYFGNFSPFFLLTNLAAIPVATAILYTFIPAMLLQKIPFAGEVAGNLLQGLLKLLNSIIEFIG